MDEKHVICLDFEILINDAIAALKINNINLALEYIHEAMLLDEHSAIIQNLLGIIAEKKGDLVLANNHYRASYALDATYEPPKKNLERITSFSSKNRMLPVQYGEINMESKI